MDLENREVDQDVAQDFAHSKQMFLVEISARTSRRIESVLRQIRGKCALMLDRNPQLDKILRSRGGLVNDKVFDNEDDFDSIQDSA